MEWKGKRRRTFTFGTWNVRGLSLPEKERETIAEIERENKDVVVLTETKLRGSGLKDFSNYIHVYSGKRVGPAGAGVSVLIKKEHSGYMRWKAINERIIKVRLQVFGQKVTILGIYGVDDNSQPQVKDRFQDALESVLKHFKKEYELVILGDMNARVGRSTNSNIIGRFGEEVINNNGRRLLELCDKYCLKIQNTFFEHDDIHKYTWYRPGGSTRTIIDYCITKQSTTLNIVDVLACRWLQCGTDHVYLEAIAMFPSAPACITNFRRYKTYLLFSENVEEQYKQHLDKSIIQEKGRSSNELYQHIKEVIHSAAHHVLGVAAKDENSEFLWDEELRKIIIGRNIKSRTKQNGDSVYRSDYDSDKLDPEIKNEVWIGICKKIDSIPNQFQKNNSILNILNEFKNLDNNTMVKDKELIEVYFKNIFKENRPQFTNWREEIKENSLFTIFPADIIQALEELEDCDVPSPGGITMRLLKHSSKKLKNLLKDLVQTIFNAQKIPDEINETFLIYQSDYKKKLNECNNSKYVPHAIMQMMSAIVKNFIEKNSPFKDTCRVLHEESRLNSTFILRLLIQKCLEKQNKPLHLVFIDLEEVFMDVPRKELFQEIRKSDVGENFRDIIKHLYNDNTIRVILPGEDSDSFPVTKGLKKECCLSPTLFQIYVRRVVKEWIKENEKKGFPVGNFKLLSLISKQTQLVIMSDKTNNLGTAVAHLQKQFKKIHLRISLKNVKYLAILDEQKREIKVGRRQISSEESFDFLGSVIENGGRNKTDVYSRIVNAKNAIGLLHSVARDKLISKSNKKRIFHSIIENCLSFGCETWTLTEEIISHLEIVEISYWKWCCENYPEHYSKGEILETMDVKDTVGETLKLKRAAWYAKVKLMTQHKWPRCILEWTPDGKTKPGRPRRRWNEGIEEFISDLNHREGFVAQSRHLDYMLTHNPQLKNGSIT